MTDPGNRPPGLGWLDHARCAGLDPNLFTMPDSYLKGRKALRVEPAMVEARAVCAACPVGAECEQDGTTDVWSIRNGKTPRERGASTVKPGEPPINHGSEAGARSHRRRGEAPCDACLAGAALAWRERKRRQTERRTA